MNTKEIVEGALLTGITVVLVLLGLFLPLVGSLLLLITPVPLIILTVRDGSKTSIIATLVSGIILSLLISPFFFLIVIFNIGLIGVSMGAAFEEKFSSITVLIVGIIATVLSFILMLGVNLYILEINIVSQLSESLKVTSDIYGSLGIKGEDLAALKDMSQGFIEIIKVTFPALLLCSGVMVASINYYLSSIILERTGYDYKQRLSLKKLKFPRSVAIIYLLSILFVDSSIGKNLLFISNFLILIQGMVVSYFYLINKLNKKLALIFVVAFFLIPIINYLLFMVGFLDLWIDFRNLDKS